MRRAAALLLLAMLGACDRPPAVDRGTARPAVWLIEDADTRIVLFGSVHQLPPGLDWQGGRLAAEIAAADELVLELSPAELDRAPALFATAARDEAVVSLDARIGETAANRVRAFVADPGIDAAAADGMESWALALAVGQRLAADTGLSTEAGVEDRLTDAFEATRRPVSGLERAGLQLAMFDDLSGAVQDRMLRALVASADQTRPRTRRLLAAWASGDLAGLSAAADEAMADTPELIEPVIRARNRAWADALAVRLRRPGNVLVAVGAGHLVGAGSLQAALAARGVTARRIG